MLLNETDCAVDRVMQPSAEAGQCLLNLSFDLAVDKLLMLAETEPQANQVALAVTEPS